MKERLEQLKHYAETGEYKRFPIRRELYADSFTPIQVLRTLRAASRHCYLLESAEEKQRWGRYSFLGFAPTMEITCTDGLAVVTEGAEEEEKIRKEIPTEHPGEIIREVLEENKTVPLEGMPPFTGGLVGYFSYEYMKYAEPTLKPVFEQSASKEAEKGGDEFRDVDLMLFDQVIVFDHYRQKLILINGVSLEGNIEHNLRLAEQKLEELENLIRNGRKEHFRALELEEEFHLETEKEAYCEMTERVKEHIYEGDIFQAVLSNSMTAKASGSLFDTYRILRTVNPSPYMFYFSSDDIEVAGASPETLAKLEDGTLYTFPLAGTRPRGKTEEEDARLERELLADEKELAEHNMLVDLGRNDLSRLSIPGTVRVEKYMEIERFSHVMHIGSTVSGKIRADRDSVDVIDAILPAGTLSGAPKLKACEIIAKCERKKRGIYGGAVGYLDFTGNMDTCISIRLAYKKNGKVCIRSGAGIVADSVPEKEYMECKNKAKAVVQAVQAAEGGIE